MNPLTKYGTSGFLKQHEQVMQGLFKLTIRPPKKIKVQYEPGYGKEEMVVVNRDGKTKIEWIPF